MAGLELSKLPKASSFIMNKVVFFLHGPQETGVLDEGTNAGRIHHSSNREKKMDLACGVTKRQPMGSQFSTVTTGRWD